MRVRHVWFSNFYYQNSCRTGSAIWTTIPSAFFWRISWNTTCHQHHRRVKKGVSAFRKSSGKSKFNVSDPFPQGGYNVKREREKWPCSYAFPQQLCLLKHTGFFTSCFRRRIHPETYYAHVFSNWINVFHFFQIEMQPVSWQDSPTITLANYSHRGGF